MKELKPLMLELIILIIIVIIAALVLFSCAHYLFVKMPKDVDSLEFSNPRLPQYKTN